MIDSGDQTAGVLDDLSSVLARRAEPMLHVMSQPASAMLLIGDPGSGKMYIAEHVARVLETAEPGSVHPFILPRPVDENNDPRAIFSTHFPQAFADEDPAAMEEMTDTFRAVKLAEELLELARHMGDNAEPLLVLPSVDRYSPRSVAVLKHLIRQQGARIIATAFRMTGGANHMGRDPRVKRLPVGPLDLAEADALLASLLNNVRIATPTLRRWHSMTGGNSHALTMMLIENERGGSLKRGHSVARVAPGEDLIPEEYVLHVEATCTPHERATLEMIAYGEPLVEPQLLRLIDPTDARNLMDRNLVTTRTLPNGRTGIFIARPILASALNSNMSPVRRVQLADQFYRALTTGMNEEELLRSPSVLVRAVEFGLEGGASLPHDWLVTAVSRLHVSGDPKLMLRVSLALARGYSTEDAAAAALRALSYAVQLGDAEAAESAKQQIDEFVADAGAFGRLPSALRTRLRLTQIERHFWLGASREDVNRQLDEFDATLTDRDLVAREAVRMLRFQMTVRDGDFLEAAKQMPSTSGADDLVIKWVRAPALSTSSLLLQQQGRLEEAIHVADHARRIALVGRRPLNETLEIQGFLWFLGFWASGSADGARDALREIELEAETSKHTGPRLLELTEIGWAMLALLEARWQDSSDLVDLILDSITLNDPYGLAPLLHAVQALALAALGERTAAVDHLKRAREPKRGIAEAYTGFRLRIALQAQQWLRLGDPADEAMKLAEWAREQRLGLVELQALHMAAIESTALAKQVQARAREVAEGIDPLIAEAIVGHIEKIVGGASPCDVSTEELRLLSDLGLWVPLPKSPGLSAREREIALMASLGYASKSIAERYHLSTRTVETHLAHIYAKLGVSDRSELREWFSASRRLG